MTKPRNPRSALRIEISRCRTLLSHLEDAEWPDTDRIKEATQAVTDAKHALTAAQRATRSKPNQPVGRY